MNKFLVSKNVEAERLAENLINPKTLPSDMIKAAAELRRLSAVNEQLASANVELLDFLERMADTRLVGMAQEDAYALIAKSKGVK